MIVVLDTNALVQMFGVRSPLAPLKDALVAGMLDVAISTGIWLEYEEVIVRCAGRITWERVARIFGLAGQIHGNVRHIEPSFHFRLITEDADDDMFADCAIAAGVDWIITEDAHFNALKGTAHKPRPITPADFIAQFLSGS